MNPSEAGTNACLHLDAEVTIRQAAELHPRLRAAIEAGLGCIDLSAVVEFDTAGLQLLAASCRSARDQGRRLQLQAPSEVVRGVCATYGLSDWLADAAV
ncbi:anti-anti-sigma factor [Sphaerotilus hippei]|uniref:Anti-anti-sigma factor n=1 Tax=Sphaerotilus hippei TaxID=744406 RepID=A0A318H232_9BURK|nr:STAS domain-containing protein [Sphaerotilus hippei]PXW95500.1 anti-anti-sigma factor [Sphaerotilus hippei]